MGDRGEINRHGHMPGSDLRIQALQRIVDDRCKIERSEFQCARLPEGAQLMNDRRCAACSPLDLLQVGADRRRNILVQLQLR